MTGTLYMLTGGMLFVIGVFGLIFLPHLLRKILSLNVSGVGIFLFLVASAYRGDGVAPDPVPHALVLTGIVIAVSATAILLFLAARLYAIRGTLDLGGSEEDS